MDRSDFLSFYLSETFYLEKSPEYIVIVQKPWYTNEKVDDLTIMNYPVSSYLVLVSLLVFCSYLYLCWFLIFEIKG